jgi:large subunit ribosomal protein L17
MHHGKSGRQLSRYTAHRQAMFRNMVEALVKAEQIETTLPKAKELRRYTDRIITLGKRGTLHARRHALGFLRSQDAVQKVFGELAKRYAARNGGYTRVLHLGPRPSDSAPMAIIELVDRAVRGAASEKSAGKGKVKASAKNVSGEEGTEETAKPAKSKKPEKKKAEKKSGRTKKD